MTSQFIAVIPARGGSKRIPRKNIRPFLGVPLLARTLEIVLNSAVFDAVIVSTDDTEIASLARECGATVPFIRPAELSGDRVATAPVVAHAISQVPDEVGEIRGVCCIYPGAVLMTEMDYAASAELVDAAIALDAVVAAIMSYSHPIQRALRLGEKGLLEPLESETGLDSPTQDFEPMWHDAGQFYWASPARWQSAEPLLKSILPYEIPHWRAQDIDVEEDWVRAEILFETARNRGRQGLHELASD